MKDKSINRNGIRLAQAATGMSPADFPLGSLGSRAAARALLDHAKRHDNELSLAEKDALTLYNGACLLTSPMSPSYPELEMTAAYRQGKDVYERLHGPIEPGLPEPFGGFAGLLFKHIFGREPVANDVMCYQDVILYDLVNYDHFIAAWHRLIPELPCPLKIEDGHIFWHQNPKHKSGHEWNGPDEHTLGHWRCVEAEANGGAYLPAKDVPTIPAVVFLGRIDGEHKCRPATATEIQLRDTGLFPETQEEQING